jgi:hypothetical protein
MSNKDEDTPAESLTLRLKKAEAAVEAATKSLKSLLTVVEREGRGVANQAEEKYADNLSQDLKKLSNQLGVVRKVLNKR